VAIGLKTSFPTNGNWFKDEFPNQQSKGHSENEHGDSMHHTQSKNHIHMTTPNALISKFFRLLIILKTNKSIWWNYWCILKLKLCFNFIYLTFSILPNGITKIVAFSYFFTSS